MKYFLRLVLLQVLVCFSGNVQAQLIANFSASSTSGCSPMVVQFTNSSSGNPTSYSWNFGNGNTSTLQNPSTTYTTPGTYSVTLTVQNAGSSNSKTITITVYAPPVVDFTASDTAGCPPLTVQFTSQVTLNAPGTGSYFWTFGTGATVTAQNPSFTFTNPGYYTITHVAISSVGCTTTVQKPAYIHAFTPPVADFSVPSPIVCGLNTPVTFSNLSTGTGNLSYQWEFGDGGTSTATNPSHGYTATGSYAITLIVTDGQGCKDTLVKPNYVIVVNNAASFTAPTSACQDDWVTFSNTTPYTIYCNWDFGDGSPNDTNQIVAHQFTTPGVYTVSLAVNNGSCTVTWTQQITIHPKPAVDFSANTLTPCPAPVTIQFTNNTVNGNNYTWYFGDGASGTQTSPTHVYNANSFYDVTLIATNNFGCSDTLVKPQYIKIYPSVLTMDVLPGDGCIPVRDSFSATLVSFHPVVGGTVPYPATIASYAWDFGDGITSTASNPVHTYTNSGTYTATLHITTSNGCSDSVSTIIHTGTPPVPLFDATPTTACVDEPIFFTNNSTNATSYDWDFGDGTTASAVNPVKSYTDPGTYTVQLIANNNGCKDTLIKQNYITINDPKAAFITSFQCDTQTKVSFINLSVNYTSCLWFFGDGTTSTLPSPVHNYPALTSYTATLVAYNSATGCTDTTSTEINLINISPDFLADDTAVCPTDEVVFTAAFPGDNFVNSYSWLFDGWLLPDTTAILPYTYYFSGYHDVALIVKDIHNCIDTITKNDYILVGHPVVNFTASNTQVCVPASVVFTNTSTLPPGTSIANLSWNFGNGNTLSTTAPTATTSYNALGIYDVILTVTDNIGCTDSLIKQQYINVHDPVALFTVNNTNGCVGAPLPFFSQSQGVQLSYFWDFGDGNTSTAAVPAHAYQQTGTYTVTLVITDAFGCKDTLVRPSYINVWDNPSASFTLSDTFRICPPLFVQLTNTSTPNCIYNWDMGDGTTNAAINPSHIYVTSGQFNIRLIAINNYGCKDTAYGQTTILGFDGVIDYAPLTGCAPLTVSFTANVQNVPGLVWDFSDGTTVATTTDTITHTYLEPGARVPRLIMTDNAGCSSTSYGLDTIRVDGIYSGFTYSPYPACDHGTLQFLDTSKGAFSTVTDRLWTFHTGQTSTSANPSQFYPAPGDYIVQLYTATNTGCHDTLTDTLTFYPLPTIDAGPDTTICLGDAATLIPSGGVSYAWAADATLSCTNCTNPQATPAIETVYSVEGTDSHGCKNTDTVRVKLKTKTDAVAGQGGEVCQGESIQLSASGAQVYSWIPGTYLDNPNIANPIATPENSITYTLIASEGSCIPDTEIVAVVVHLRPTVDAGPDQTIIAGDVAYIDATGTLVTRYEWTPAETLSCDDCEDPEARPRKTTTYHVIAYSDFGCTDSDRVTVFVNCGQSQVFMPNSFTPNGDGQNDYFYPRGKGIQIIKSFRIYNRWGELIFERKGMNTNELANGWDGTYKGQVLPPDVFLYIVDAICDTGEPVSWKGDISLIR